MRSDTTQHMGVIAECSHWNVSPWLGFDPMTLSSAAECQILQASIAGGEVLFVNSIMPGALSATKGCENVNVISAHRIPVIASVLAEMIFSNLIYLSKVRASAAKNAGGLY